MLKKRHNINVFKFYTEKIIFCRAIYFTKSIILHNIPQSDECTAKPLCRYYINVRGSSYVMQYSGIK